MASKKSIVKAAPKQIIDPALFAAEWMKDMNARAAVIRCGYTGRSPSKRGHDMLHKPEVQAIVTQRTKAQAERVEISNDQLKYEIQRCAVASMEHYTVVDSQGMPHFDFANLTPDQWAAISEITTETVMESTGEYDDDGKPIKQPIRKMKFKLHDKLKASQLLAQVKGMITTKQEITNPDGSLRQPPALNIVVVNHTAKE